MTFLKKAFITLSTIPGFHFGMLLCLMFLSFFVGIGLSCFDAATVRLFVENSKLFLLGYDLLFVSFLLFFLGYIHRGLAKRKGYGSIAALSVLFVLTTPIIWGVGTQAGEIYMHLLFMGKYALFSLFVAALFLIVSRFVPLRLGSLKRVCITGSLFLGFAFGPFLVYALSLGAYSTLYISFVLLLGCYFSLYVLTKFVPVEKDVFVAKTGEVKDLSELKLVRSVCLFCFSFFAIKCICDFVFYQYLGSNFNTLEVWQFMLYWWMTLGCFGFLSGILLFRTRYFYMISGGIVLFLIGVVCVLLGLKTGLFVPIFIGTILATLSMLLYFENFVNALLRLLNQGLGQSINKKRWVVIEPLGFLTGALCCIYFENLTLVLLFFIIALLVAGILSLTFYSSLLIKLFKIRAWRGGPLLLIDKKVISYIQKHIGVEHKNDVIYFLRVLEVSNKWLYLKWLLKSLKHKNESIRLYVLEKMASLYTLARHEKTIELVFLKDASIKVRCRALSLLIQIAYEEKEFNGINAFLPYLDDKKLRIGAMCGFLKTGGAPALLAAEGLQKLVDSKRIKDNLLALSIIEWAPSVGLVRLLMRLLKSTTPVVASKALLVASKIMHPECLPIIITSLDDVQLRENALVALKSYGINAFPLIERTINNPEIPVVRLKTLILFLTMLPSGEGKQILLRALQIGNQKLRKIIIQGMIDRGIFWVHKNKYNLLFSGIQKDVNRILWLTHLLHKYRQVSFPQTSEVYAFLMRAIMEDIEETRETILYQLLLLKDNALYEKAVRLLLLKKEESKALALSSLQDMLPKKLFRLVKMALEDIKMDERAVTQMDITVDLAARDVCALLKDAPFTLPNWIKTTALYCLRMLDCQESLPVVKSYLKSKNPLVLEAAIWAFCKLERNEEERHRILLTLPTSQLVLQSLDTILEN
ncbi:MAG: hypothetical protein IJY92_04310 [Alphaproteobacteria bacterium]|nr:hypothetical protein [Alphaproteobacteria bacterium]